MKQAIGNHRDFQGGSGYRTKDSLQEYVEAIPQGRLRTFHQKSTFPDANIFKARLVNLVPLPPDIWRNEAFVVRLVARAGEKGSKG